MLFDVTGYFVAGTAAGRFYPFVPYRAFDKEKKGHSVLRTFQRAPSEEEMNDIQRAGTKRIDLGWVYTVIAGVLNLLVMYDAFAGPMFRDVPAWAKKKDEDETPPAAGTTPEGGAS